KEYEQQNMVTEMKEKMQAEEIDMFEQKEIKNVEYEMTIDKESFDIDNLKMDMEMDMEVEGENLNTQQNIDMDYISINEVDAIEIPEDVKDEAMDEEEFQEQIEEEFGD